MNDSKFEYWYEQYMINGVSISTLSKLVKAKKLAQEEVDKMISDRLKNTVINE